MNDYSLFFYIHRYFTNNYETAGAKCEIPSGNMVSCTIPNTDGWRIVSKNLLYDVMLLLCVCGGEGVSARACTRVVIIEMTLVLFSHTLHISFNANGKS